MGGWNLQKHLGTWESIVPANSSSAFRCYQRKIPWGRKKAALPSSTRQASILVEYVFALAAGSIQVLLFTFLKFVLSVFTPAGQLWAFSLVWASPLRTLCYHQSEQDQVNPAIFLRIPLLLTKLTSQGGVLFMHTVKQTCSYSSQENLCIVLQRDTQVAVSQRGGILFAAETSLTICSHQ